LTFADSILWSITVLIRQHVYKDIMMHWNHERMFISSDSDEVQKQRLPKCMFHIALHIKHAETSCGIHKQLIMQKKI
jgi:hypothetical protein